MATRDCLSSYRSPKSLREKKGNLSTEDLVQLESSDNANIASKRASWVWCRDVQLTEATPMPLYTDEAREMTRIPFNKPMLYDLLHQQLVKTVYGDCEDLEIKRAR